MSEYKNKISSLCLENFTVFKKACFDFCPGINVMIGANGTGKSHVMKVAYSLVKAINESFEFEISGKDFYAEFMGVEVENSFKEIFRLDKSDYLIRTNQNNNTDISFNYFENICNFKILKKSESISSPFVQYSGGNVTILKNVLNPIFLPAQEFLSINEGFISAYNKRELPYDSTFYDLSIALNDLPLRKKNLDDVWNIILLLKSIVAGEPTDIFEDAVFQRNGRFYVRVSEGSFDVHQVAEGYRKIATLYYLLRNGSLTKDSILFWDEPETNLNPKLIVQLVDVLKRLAALGMQIFIATHDYLLSYELSLLAEYPSEPNIDIKFFALHKPERTAGVEVESGRTLAEIENNPILEEFAAHYDRESALFHHREKEEQSNATD
ncbi:MAG: ATP/GTP-binding protein [Desulfococcaceae bacterium]